MTLGNKLTSNQPRKLTSWVTIPGAGQSVVVLGNPMNSKRGLNRGEDRAFTCKTAPPC